MSHLKNLVKAKERMNPLREYKADLLAHRAKILNKLNTLNFRNMNPAVKAIVEEIERMVREIK